MKKLILLSLIAAILVGCGTSNSVVNDGLFQKRKYRSGWFVKKKKGVEKEATIDNNLAQKKTEKEITKTEENSTPQNKQRKELSHIVVKHKQTSTNDEPSLSKKSKNDKSSEQKSGQQTTSNAKPSNAAESTTITIDKFRQENKEQLHKKENKNYDNSSSSSGDVEFILMFLLALIVPPIVVYLIQDTSKLFIIDLILFIVGWGSVWFFNLGGIAALVAVVIAILVLFGVW